MAIETINGRQVGITRTGDGAPMLMLHCALAHRGVLAPLMARLPGRSFIAFDLPGHGESEFDRSADIQAQAVETAVSLLEDSGPGDVFGHSFGATVALKLALERPELVRSLSLYEPVYFSVLASTDPAAYQAESEASASFTAAAQARNWPEAARAFLSRWNLVSFDDLPKAQQAYILKTIPHIMASNPSIIAPESGKSLLDALPALAPPMLLLEGSESPATIDAINSVLTTSGAQATKERIAGAGHMGPITHAAAVARAITAQNS